MKILIEARPVDSDDPIIQIEVGSILEGSLESLPEVATEAVALAMVRKLAQGSNKYKFYRHIHKHEESKSCELKEIK